MTRLRILAWRAGPAPQTLRMGTVIRTEPLELEYLDTVLSGHDVTLLDGLADRRDPVRLARRLRAQVVLISACITNTNLALRVARRLKSLPEAPRVFLGGPHFEVVPEHGCGDGMDGVFFADALAGIAAVADRIARGLPYVDVPGAIFRTPSGWQRNPGQPLDPAALPIPRRRQLERYPGRYNYMYLRPCAVTKTSFGCTGRCTFCFCAHMNGGRFSARPPARVADEIAALPVPSVFLVDDDLLCDPSHARALCSELAARGCRKSLVAYGAVRDVVRDPGVVRDLAAVGLVALILGLESVSDSDLQGWRKGATAADADRAIAVCRDCGVEVFALFVVDPGWRHGDFLRLARFLLSRRLAFATFSTLQAFPGTDLAGRPPLVPGSLAIPEPPPDLWRWDLLRLPHRPRHMGRATFYGWLFLLYLLPGLRPATLRVLLRRYGRTGCLRLIGTSVAIGIDYCYRLLRWP